MNDINNEASIPPNQIFYSEQPIKQDKPDKEKPKSDERQTAFVTKGSNLQLKEPYDIRFTIGSGPFSNMIEFVNMIGYDAFIQFKKKEMTMIVIDTGNTHASVIKFDKTELADYDVKGLENDDSQKSVYIDISPIVEELSINESYPIDFYVDTLEKHRYYVVCGKEYIWKQLNTMRSADESNSVNTRYNNFKETINRLTNNTNYQKVVVNSSPLGNLMKSLGKKTEKGKDVKTICSMYLNKYQVDWRIQSESRGSSITLSGDDIVVYPINEDNIETNLTFFNKFGRVKSTFTVAIYMYRTLPLIFESKLGGGKIVLLYLIAPYVENG